MFKIGVIYMKKIKNMFLDNKKMVIIGAVVLVVLIGGIILFLSNSNDNAVGEKVKYKDYVLYEGHVGKVEKYDPSMVVEGYDSTEENAYYISGKMSANSDKGFSIIEFNLYDKDDKLLGTAVAGLNDLKKGEVYEFKALGLISGEDVLKVDHYELKSVELGN